MLLDILAHGLRTPYEDINQRNLNPNGRPQSIFKIQFAKHKFLFAQKAWKFLKAK